MIDTVNVTFYKQKDSESQGLTWVVNDIKKLPLGGRDDKFEITLSPASSDIDGDQFKFFAKKLPYYDVDDVNSIIQANSKLASIGFTVPNTMRYFKYEGADFLLMTEMTENGKYQIWGLSGNSTIEQDQELKSMKIGLEEMSEIRTSIMQIANKADTNKVKIYSSMYHLRRDRDSGKFDFPILDTDSETLNYNNYLTDGKSFNEIEATYFIESLSKKLELNNGS